MSKGYVTIAQDSGDIDYIRMAYALALSIRATQSKINKLSILVTEGTQIQPRYQDAFDKIIEMPWGDDAQNKNWKVNNKWKYIYTTPYTETIALDADMLFLSDISSWWNFLSKKGIWMCTHARTFRNELITSDYYRRTFTVNKLPNVYTAFFYFNKDSQIAWDLFNYVEHIFHNGKLFFDEYLVAPKPKWFSADIAYSMAIKLMDIEEECTSNIFGYPTFIHMKSMLQNVENTSITDNWLEHFPTYFTDDLSLKIGNHKQYLPFHYHKKEWLTDDIINKLERKVYG